MSQNNQSTNNALTSNLAKTPPFELSELAGQFTQMVNFMQRRADIRTHLMQSNVDNSLNAKNSLSKLKKSKHTIKQKNNIENQTALQQIMQQLAEQLSEGHTILTLNTEIFEQNQLYHHLKNSEWVHILPNQVHSSNNQIPLTINKPLIMQIISQENGYEVWDNGDETKSSRIVVWLHRQWYAERQLALQLLTIAKRTVTQLNIDSLDTTAETKTLINETTPIKTANDRQQLAIHNACCHALSIITGGPGTGKTFTVAQLVIALQHAHNDQKKLNPYLPPLSIALTAPTGKAAQRMQESLLQNLQGEKIQLDNAKTLHRLLGIGSNGMPRYHHDNPLPDDLVIVDEASMLGLELASQLVDAIKPTGRLILLGDANQLAAVDAGAVLADLCLVEVLQPYRTELTESRRFDDTSAIGQLALMIKQSAITTTQKKQKIQAVKKLLKPNATNSAINFYKIEYHTKNATTPHHSNDYKMLYQQMREPFGAFFAMTKALLKQPLTLATLQPPKNLEQPLQTDKKKVASSELEKLFQSFDKYRILSAGHHGKLGDRAINQMISQYHKRKILNLPLSDSYFYHGQPIMMLHNDYQLGVFNGDIGICLLIDNPQDSQPPQLMACFTDKVIEISQLNSESCATAYALTIHKSQGSEFERVTVCLDSMHGRLLSQELIYTAVTRSKQTLDIYSNEMLLNTAILQKGNRQTGLALQF